MESDIITVNLDERDEISTKDLFSEIQLIPLETTPESVSYTHLTLPTNSRV